MQNNPDSSSDCSDEDDVDVKISESVISELSEKVSQNPYAYDQHVQLIELLRKAGELDRLREARENMATYFPLTPQIWLQWIKDESSISVDPDSRDAVKSLFRRALVDYQSVDVWLEFCQFILGGMTSGSDSELAEVRTITEEAIANQGLNFANGAILWEFYREFEMIVLSKLQSDPSNTEAIVTQVKKIDSIFRRQLSVPHQDIQSTMSEYKDFLSVYLAKKSEENNEVPKIEVSAECLEAFSRASAKMDACMPFEDKLEDAESDEAALLAAWEPYLKWAIANSSQKVTRTAVQKKLQGEAPPLSPSEVICLLERAITSLCLQPIVWLHMADYLETHVASDVNRLLSTLARAVRNVPWSGAVWQRYALASEAMAWKQASVDTSVESLNGSSNRNHSTTTEHESLLSKALKQTEVIYETAVKYTFAVPSDLLLIWTSYCDFWLRRFLQSSDDEVNNSWISDNLRSTFERAVDSIESKSLEAIDPDCTLLRYWAFVEAKFLRDSGRAQALWTRMMKTGDNGTKPSFWISYLDFEKNLGDLKHLLRVAGMAVNSITGDYSETVFVAATRSLAEAGVDLQRLRDFEGKVRTRRAHLLSDKVAKNLDSTPARSDQKPRRDSDVHGVPSGKRKFPEDEVLSSESHFKAPDQLPKKPQVGGANSESPTVQSEVETSSSSTATKRPRHGETVPHDSSKDNRTAFISNLPFKVTEADLKDTFEKCGKIESVRLVRDFAGKSKGFAYVEFASPSSVPDALSMDRQPIVPAGVVGTDGQPLVGRPMFVSRCEPNRSEPKPFAFSTGAPEPKKLFVRNLDKQVREDALKTLFGQYGTVTSVRLATFRNGMPKGLAYVEFSTEEEASRALVATDGLSFGNSNISVAISNPPQRSNAPRAQNFSSNFSEKNAHSSSVRSHAQSQLSFMPRAIYRGAVPKSTNELEDIRPADSGDAPKSNDDFRKMLLKN